LHHAELAGFAAAMFHVERPHPEESATVSLLEISVVAVTTRDVNVDLLVVA
jgi:hypothetical protein